MPATIRTETYNTLLTTTLRNMRGSIRDEISTSQHFLAYLDFRGRKRFVSDGRTVDVPLMYELNQTGDVYQGYGVLDTTPPDGHTVNGYPWANLGLTISVNGSERRANQGKSAIFNLINVKKSQAVATAKEMLSSALIVGNLAATGSLSQFTRVTGRIDPSALGPYPLPALVDANPSRSVTIGEINGATNSWYRNFALASTATTYNGVMKEFLRCYMEAEKGVGGPPDIMLGDQKAWELYFSHLETKERYMVTDQRVIDVLGGSRDSLIMYRNAPFIWDEHTPDVGTTTATPVNYFNSSEVGTYGGDGAHSTVYFLNSQALEYIVHSQADWITTPFIPAVNAPDTSTAGMLWQGQLVANSRRKHSVLYDIDNTISS